MEASLTVVFGGEEQEVLPSFDLLKLEQEEWTNTYGQMTYAEFYEAMYSIVLGGSVSTGTCSLEEDGTIACVIWAYPYTSDLEYKLYTSYGYFTTYKLIELSEQAEMINFNLGKEGSLSYSPKGGALLSSGWIGDVYDSQGNVISSPDVSIEGPDLITSGAVYGSYSVTYLVEKHKYVLKVPPREEGTDLFGAVVYGVYPGGISWLEITPPPYADELSEGSLDCSLGSTVTADEDDGTVDPSIPTSCSTANREIQVDYCTQEIISDETYYVEGQ